MSYENTVHYGSTNGVILWDVPTLREKKFRNYFLVKKVLYGAGNWRVDHLGYNLYTRVSTAFRGVTKMEELAIKIDTGVPLPRRKSAYPFRDMDVGDSILFTVEARGASARVASAHFCRLHAPKWAFSLRKVENGWRLWRTA